MVPLRIVLTFAFTGLIGVAAPAHAAGLDHSRIAERALDQHILPGYERLAAAFSGLRASTEAHCNADGAVRLKPMRERFAEVVRAWGAMAHLHFGPVRTDNHYERIWFWPDRKSIAQRQVIRALRSKPEDYRDSDELGKKSIAVQGLGALEFVFYANSSPLQTTDNAGAAFACRYGQAIAANLETIAGDIHAAWAKDGAYGRLWLDPGPENRAYLSDRETSFALIRALMDGLARVRDYELARPLGVGQSRRVLPGPFDRSGLTMTFIAARIGGLRALFEDTALSGALMALAEAENDAIAAAYVRQALFEFELMEPQLRELADQDNVFEPDSAARAQLVALGFPMKSARDAIASAAGRLTTMPVGFNAGDGD